MRDEKNIRRQRRYIAGAILGTTSSLLVAAALFAAGALSGIGLLTPCRGPLATPGPEKPVDMKEITERFAPSRFSFFEEISTISQPPFSIGIGGVKAVGAPCVVATLDSRYAVINDLALDVPVVRLEKIGLKDRSGQPNFWHGIDIGDSVAFFPEDPHVMGAYVLYGAGGGIYPLKASLQWISPKGSLDEWKRSIEDAGFEVRRVDGEVFHFSLKRESSEWTVRMAVFKDDVQFVEVMGSTAAWGGVAAKIGMFYEAVDFAIRQTVPLEVAGWRWREPAVIPRLWAGSTRSFGAVSEVALADWGFPGDPPISGGTARIWNPGRMLVDVSLSFNAEDTEKARKALSELAGVVIPESGSVTLVRDIAATGERVAGGWTVRIEDRTVKSLALVGDMAFGGGGTAEDARRGYVERIWNRLEISGDGAD